MMFKHHIEHFRWYICNQKNCNFPAKNLANLDQIEAENAWKRRNSGSEIHSDRLSSWRLRWFQSSVLKIWTWFWSPAFRRSMPPLLQTSSVQKIWTGFWFPWFQTSSVQKIWIGFWGPWFQPPSGQKIWTCFWARDFKGVAFRSSGLDCGGQKSNTSSGSRNQSQKLINISWLCDSAKVVLVQLEYCTGKSHTILHRERESESIVIVPKVDWLTRSRYGRTWRVCELGTNLNKSWAL